MNFNNPKLIPLNYIILQKYSLNSLLQIYIPCLIYPKLNRIFYSFPPNFFLQNKLYFYYIDNTRLFYFYGEPTVSINHTYLLFGKLNLMEFLSSYIDHNYIYHSFSQFTLTKELYT